MTIKKSILLTLMLSVSQASDVCASASDDAHIRQIVQQMLKQKDQKIEQLEARIHQLEQEKQLQQVQAKPEANGQELQGQLTPVASKAVDPSINGKLKELDQKIASIKDSARENGLEISGFFDINAKTSNSTDQTFSVGSVELDLDYAYDEHFGASSALVLCGNSSNTDYAAPVAVTCGNSGPGGLSGGGTSAGIAVALVDYHLFNDRIPPRGRIFNNQGLHIQAGRFDLPFGTDYQNFANKDRITITAPLTTSRMQLGGYNSDGVRSYGAWKWFNYSLFWTDALYANDGHAVGGRLGLSLGQNNFQVHTSHPSGIEIGASYLSELDRKNIVRNNVYGLDFSFNYAAIRWQNELMLLESHQDLFLAEDAEGNPLPTLISDQSNYPLAKGRQLGYHSTLMVDLESLTKHNVVAFARYSSWQPSQKWGWDYDGVTTVALNDINMLSLGLNYKFNDHLRFKLEYNDSIGTWIAERYFDKRMGIAQVVLSF